MYRCVTFVRVTQQPTRDFPSRNGVLTFDYVHEFTADDNWTDLTGKGSLIIPKNLYYKDAFGKPQPLNGTNINVGGFGLVPLFLKGDQVMIEGGYKYYNKQGAELIDTAIQFEGWISGVHSEIPITLDLEDNMWKLKQVPVPTHTFKSSDTLEDILAFLLKGTSFNYKALTTTTFGEFQIGNETVAQVLYRLKKQFGFQFYFRGDQLRGGTIVYLEEEAETQLFRFQQNIISDELEYVRKDDVVLSAIVHNTITENTGKTTKDGRAKTRRTRLEVLVTIKNGEATYKEIKKGDIVPENTEGERREFFFPGAATVDQLGKLGYDKLIRYYYTGLKGSFTTFGIPFVRQGDNVDIKDPLLPERDGVYKVKSVERVGGYNHGLRQRIYLDFKLSKSA